MKTRVVITGLGCITAGSDNIKEFLDLLKSEESAISRVDALVNNDFNCQIGGIPCKESQNFVDTINANNLKFAGDATKFFVHSGIQAWIDSGLHIPSRESSDVDYNSGCIIGSVYGNIDLYTDDFIKLLQTSKPKKLRSTVVEQMSFSAPSATLAGILALGNLVMSNSCACSSSTESILQCYERIKSGKAIRMIAGGTEAFSLNAWSMAESLGLSTTAFNYDPQKGSCALSMNASGTVPGAGAGAIVLESYETAVKRGANIYAEILGGISICGGQRSGGSMYTPNPIALKKCIEATLNNTRVKTNEIDLISGHLNSTNFDLLEINTWTKALKRKAKDFPYINAIKSYVGYTIGAEGILEIIVAALELKNQFIAPNLNSRPLHEYILNLVDEERIPEGIIYDYPLNYVIKGSFGFGDVNTCIILKRFND